MVHTVWILYRMLYFSVKNCMAEKKNPVLTLYNYIQLWHTSKILRDCVCMH